jgi:cardiolipin synthase A/B
MSGMAPLPPTTAAPEPRRRRGRAATPTVVKVVGGFAIIIVVFLLLVHDTRTLLIESTIPADDATFPQYLATLAGSHLTEGDRFDVLLNGDEIFPAMLGAIEAARERISLETYIYDKGEMGEAFTVALEQAARRGVHVRVVVDAVGSKGMDRDHLARLEAAGARVAIFNPLRWYTIRHVNFRTHRKILVIDGRVAFTGGAGIGDQWIGNAGSADEWRDTHLRVVGPAAHMLEGAFYDSWFDTGQRDSADLLFNPSDPGTGARSIVAWSSPTGGSNSIQKLYLLLIAAARRSLDIQSPYFVVDDSTRLALFEARQRGVTVRVLVEGERTDALPVKYASRADYDALLTAGIEIYEYQPTMMHVKAMMVDRTWAVVGSTNFDPRSFKLNHEVSIASFHAPLAETLVGHFEADLQRSVRLRLDAWRTRPLGDKARERLWTFFSQVF